MSTETVAVSPELVAAAKLRVTLDSRLGRQTSPVIAKIAAADTAHKPRKARPARTANHAATPITAT